MRASPASFKSAPYRRQGGWQYSGKARMRAVEGVPAHGSTEATQQARNGQSAADQNALRKSRRSFPLKRWGWFCLRQASAAGMRRFAAKLSGTQSVQGLFAGSWELWQKLVPGSVRVNRAVLQGCCLVNGL